MSAGTTSQQRVPHAAGISALPEDMELLTLFLVMLMLRCHIRRYGQKKVEGRLHVTLSRRSLHTHKPRHESSKAGCMGEGGGCSPMLALPSTGVGEERRRGKWMQ